MCAGLWLEYGLDRRDNLAHIADAPEHWKSSLRCPYCQGELIADTIARRFAHVGETCPLSMRKEDAPVLPLYHDFTLGLTPRELNALRAVDSRGQASDEALVSSLARCGFCRWNPYRGRGMGYELTRLGKILFGQLSLCLFNQAQEALIENRMDRLRKKAKTGDPVARADLRIFRALVRRIQVGTLYFLEIQTGVQPAVLHKIGFTTEQPDEHLPKIAAELHPHFPVQSIGIAGAWAGRGGVVPYFGFRHQAASFKAGSLAGYFAFENPASVMRHLNKLPMF